MLKKYNPKRINSGWFNIPFLGYMEGTFIEVEYDEDAVTTHVGGGGDVSLILNANTMAKLVVTLIQGSPTNAKLSALVPSSSRDFLPTAPISLTDLNGTTLVGGPNAFIKKMAKVEFGKSLTGRQWTFIIPQAIIFAGEGGD